MKKLLLLSFLLTCISVFSQTTDRVKILGQIHVPPNAEAAGITIYNMTSKNGTVTDDDGLFSIPVAVNDRLSVSAVQYQPFVVIIDEGVIDTGMLNITVREAVNELDEVVVRPYDLSGNVRVDIMRVEPIFEPSLMSGTDMLARDVYFPPDRATEVENIAMDDPYIKNGIQFVNIFKAVFLSNDDANSKSPEPKKNIEKQIREIYKDEFFKKYINIEKESIDEFILYAESNGLSYQLLQSGNELDLIEFLIAQGKKFKQQENED